MRDQLETLIAVCALLIATIAAGASAYQTYVINEQFSATVWPYLSFGTTTDATTNKFVELNVRNVGLGPAIVRDTVVTVDGKPLGPGKTGNPVETAIATAVKDAEAEEIRMHQHGKVHTTTSSVLRGDVIPAGSSTTLMRAEGPLVVKRIIALRSHFDLSFCYCSVLGRCWTRRLKDPVDEPRDVRSCPLPR